MARSHNSAPARAISSLFAVTTDLPRAIAASTISRATPVPPTSSATISISGCSTTSRQFAVFSAAPNAAGICLLAMPRLHTARTSQRKAQLQRDIARVFRKDVERARADVAQTDDAYLNWLHKVDLLI